MIDKSGEPFCAAMDGTLERTGRVTRMIELAESALDEVLDGVPAPASSRVLAFLGLPEPSREFTDREVRDLCGRLAARCAPRNCGATPAGRTARLLEVRTRHR
ncbi:hypothetical protein [Sorangium sp. So ce388]|uniref:hypothetical protein n=1 Tax=Sorangium sp. So ce388 TaxID=3133309 RepID=UPI003F5BC8BC